MVIDKYIDPENTEEIFRTLGTLKTIGEVKKLISEIYPSWIITVIDGYSDDYPELTLKWRLVCDKMNIKPAQMIIVDEIINDKNHTLIMNFSECLTRAGFVVRRKYEYFPCETCGKAIPSEMLWEILSKNSSNIPTVWSDKCSSC